MFMHRKMITAVAIALAVANIATAAPAERTRSFHRSVQGPNGQGFTRSFHQSLGRESGSAIRDIQASNGRGLTSYGQYVASDRAFNSSRTHVTNGGTTWGRSTTATANGNGAVDYNRTYTGPNGGTAVRSGSIGY